jgi:hypothetical protein
VDVDAGSDVSGDETFVTGLNTFTVVVSLSREAMTSAISAASVNASAANMAFEDSRARRTKLWGMSFVMPRSIDTGMVLLHSARCRATPAHIVNKTARIARLFACGAARSSAAEWRPRHYSRGTMHPSIKTA